MAFSLHNVHCLRLGLYLIRATSRKLPLQAHSNDSLSLKRCQYVTNCNTCHTGFLFKWLRVRMASIKIRTELKLCLLRKRVPADKSLDRPERKQARKDARRRARFQRHRDASFHQVFSSLQGKAPKEIHDILRETLACFLLGRAKDLSAYQYIV